MSWTVRILVGVAVLGAVAGGAVVLRDSGPSSAAASGAVAREPEESQVAGSGIVEASSGTIAVGTPVTCIVKRMDVIWGQRVTKGQPLFRIDARDLLNRRSSLLAGIAQAEAGIPAIRRKLAAIADPRMASFVTRNDLVQRQSDLAVAEANVAAARASLHDLDAEVARRTVRAPVSGRILKINVRPGEFAEAAGAATGRVAGHR